MLIRTVILIQLKSDQIIIHILTTLIVVVNSLKFSFKEIYYILSRQGLAANFVAKK